MKVVNDDRVLRFDCPAAELLRAAAAAEEVESAAATRNRAGQRQRPKRTLEVPKDCPAGNCLSGNIIKLLSACASPTRPHQVQGRYSLFAAIRAAQTRVSFPGLSLSQDRSVMNRCFFSS